MTITKSSKTQQTQTQSSAEAELYARGTTVNNVIYVRNFLHELNLTTDNRLIPPIYTDRFPHMRPRYTSTPRATTPQPKVH
eukprot:5209420-Amphidinium_carterae.1